MRQVTEQSAASNPIDCTVTANFKKDEPVEITFSYSVGVEKGPSNNPNYTQINKIYFYVTLSGPADKDYQIMADVQQDTPGILGFHEANLTIKKGETSGKCLAYEMGPDPQNLRYSNVTKHAL